MNANNVTKKDFLIKDLSDCEKNFFLEITNKSKTNTIVLTKIFNGKKKFNSNDKKDIRMNPHKMLFSKECFSSIPKICLFNKKPQPEIKIATI